MKKIICKKEYDTETATLIKKYSFGALGDPAGYEEDLYQTEGGTVLVPEGYPAVEELVRSAGYDVLLVDTSQFRKIDGGLSCLSLRFTALK